MRRPFDSLRGTAVFGLLLIFVLSLPIILHRIGGVSKYQVYAGVPFSAAQSDYLRKQIFEDRSPLDVLFAGSSLMSAAIDVPFVRREFSKSLGRPAGVKLLMQAWEGLDMVYLETSDLLEHRPVKLLVFAVPRLSPVGVLEGLQSSNRPHVQLFRLARFGDYPDAFSGLKGRFRMAVYTDYVLGAPRHALSLLRPNIPGENNADWDSEVDLEGPNGRPFVSRAVRTALVPPAQFEYSQETASRFNFIANPLSEYQYHFLNKLVELTHRHGTALVLLHINLPPERNSPVVVERARTTELLGDRVRFVGMPFHDLFGEIPAEQVEDFYRDTHFNHNGQLLFTQSVTPVLRRIYESDALR